MANDNYILIYLPYLHHLPKQELEHILFGGHPRSVAAHDHKQEVCSGCLVLSLPPCVCCKSVVKTPCSLVVTSSLREDMNLAHGLGLVCISTLKLIKNTAVNTCLFLPRPMFEDDVPSVLELEMEDLEKWMVKDGVLFTMIISKLPFKLQ